MVPRNASPEASASRDEAPGKAVDEYLSASQLENSSSSSSSGLEQGDDSRMTTSYGVAVADVSMELVPSRNGDGSIDEVRRKPMPRKGHSKSRRGCFQCKRRRVKCSEELPRCRHCARNHVSCEYPVPQQPTSSSASSPLPSEALRTTPTVFGLEDLRFFHHFLVLAYPPIPFGSKPAWDSLATMVHEYDFLAHAFLGLAAQHLTRTSDTDYSSQSLKHRVAAMKALNGALSRPCRTVADRDARYGAILALTFQAACMPDALDEFLVTMRGCLVIGGTIVGTDGSWFRGLGHASYKASFERLITDADVGADDGGNKACGDPHVLDDAGASLRLLAPLCRSVVEVRYLVNLERIIALARTSLTEAYLQLALSFILTNRMTDQEFAAFTEPGNHTAQVLLAHFLILDHVVETWTLGPNGLSYPVKRDISLQWVENVAAKVPTSYRKYLIWPVGSVAAIRQTRYYPN